MGGVGFKDVIEVIFEFFEILLGMIGIIVSYPLHAVGVVLIISAIVGYSNRKDENDKEGELTS